jgi:hypothetical protein
MSEHSGKNVISMREKGNGRQEKNRKHERNFDVEACRGKSGRMPGRRRLGAYGVGGRALEKWSRRKLVGFWWVLHE